MKKLISIALALLMVVSLVPLSALAANDDYETVTGTIMFNAGHDDMETDHPCPFTYSDAYFADTAYNYRQDLATATMAMCLASGNVADPARYKEGPANLKDFFDQIGFEDFEANEDFTNRPGRNTFGVGIANKEISVNGEKFTVIGIGLRGCGYYAEWAGDLNVGLEGEHTGFAICRDKALAFLQEYLANHPEITGKIKIWCTGYSRGAAGANLLGGRLDDMIMAGQSIGKNVTLAIEDLYIYTFEAPMGADINNVVKKVYNNIHNVVNYNDLVAKVAPECMGFARYGVDHVMPSAKLDDNYAELKAEMLKVFSTFENAGEYRIDDFKYVTVTPGATADKIISSISGNVMTQGEFLDDFVGKLFTKVFSTRAEVYAAQGDLQELILPLIGTYPDQWDTVKQSLAENAKENLAGIMAALMSGSEASATEVIADVILDTMRDAGITEYDAAQIRSMIKPLVTVMLKLVAACPDETATLLYNIVGIMSAHYGELGMSWMMTIPDDYMIKKQLAASDDLLPFVDVPKGMWCYDEVSYAYENGLMKGKTANTFVPNGSVTRGQVVTVLYRLAGEPSVKGQTCPLTDLSTSWCQDAIIWGYNNKVVNGFADGSFGTDVKVTREQLAAFLYRYADVFVYDGNISAGSDFAGSFKDAGSVSAFALTAMIWANENGIVNGTADGRLNPQGNASRAEFACMIARFDRSIIK